MRLALAIVAFALTLGFSAGGAATAQESPRIAVVVGPGSNVTAVTKDELRELYLKRRRMWSTGQPAVPLNLPAQHALRIAFSLAILGRLPEQLLTHWDRQYFDGIAPPAVVQTGTAVCEYVGAEPNAIGYLAPADVTDRCRVVLLLEP